MGLRILLEGFARTVCSKYRIIAQLIWVFIKYECRGVQISRNEAALEVRKNRRDLERISSVEFLEVLLASPRRS